MRLVRSGGQENWFSKENFTYKGPFILGMHPRKKPNGGPRRRPGKRAGPAHEHGAGDEHGEYGVEEGFARRCGRFAIACSVRFIVPVLLLLVLAVGLGYFRLKQGPASLKFLVGPVEQGIGAELSGLTPKIDDVVVTLMDGGGLEFQLINLRLFEADGGLVASAPSAAMHLSALALWSARVVPSQVVLIEPRVFLSYSRREGLGLRIARSETLEGLTRGPERARNPGNGALLDSAGELEIGQGSLGRAEGDLGEGGAATARRIDVARMITEATERARRGEAASSFLRELGLRDATVVVDHEGHLSSWHVPRVSIDLDHRQSSSIVSGFASISSARGPWTLSFRLEDSVEESSFAVTAAVRGLVPRTLGQALPGVGLLKPLDVAVNGDARLTFSHDGKLGSGRLDLELGRGRIHVQSLSNAPVAVDGGLIRLVYDAGARRLVLEPSNLRWGAGSLTLVGQAVADKTAASNGLESWQFDIKAQQGVVSAKEFGVPPQAIDNWSAVGAVWPARSIIQLKALNIGAGGGEISIAGEIDSSAMSPGTGLETKLNNLPVGTLKALWPRGVSTLARDWVGQYVSDGRITSGTFKFLSGRYLNEPEQANAFGHRLAIAIELSDVRVRPGANLPEVEMPRALVRVENNTLEIAVPKASAVAADKQVMHLTAGRYTAVNIDSDSAVGEIVFAVKSKVAPVLALLSVPSVNFVNESDLPPKGVSGDVAGDVRLNFPVGAGIRLADVKVGGKLRVSDGRADNVFGDYDIQGATLDFDITEGAMDARGEILLAGVPAKLNWQYIFGGSEDKQPPLRITATLDNSDRRQLGLQLDTMVLGEVPVVLTIAPRSGANDKIHLRADLTNADLFIESVAWAKKPGRSAALDCDVVTGSDAGGKYAVLLSNMTIAGEDIGVKGWVGIDETNQIVAFEFPEFTLNLVSRLKVSGRLKSGPVWAVSAVGTTFDGRSFFKSLFSVGRVGGREVAEVKPGEGIDLKAKIDTVLGFEDVALKSFSLKISKRGGRLSVLKASGTLSGGEPLNVNYRGGGNEPRMLVANSRDAGEVLRLVGFYPNMRGGSMRLDVQLDGRGPAEKTGMLRVRSFNILGDSVVSEVFSNTQDGQPAISIGQGGRRRAVREVFPFDTLQAPFSVGHGQFVLQDAFVKGPVLGATLRGKVDYTSRTLQIGGTYVPLQGLNNVFGDIPLLGELLSGPRGEGIFGMTFAVQGSMGNPQVIVNPLSMVAPGILREIFQLTPNAPRVQPRTLRKGGSGDDWDVRSSSAPAIGGRGRGRPARKRSKPSKQTIDGWSARTNGQ